MSYLIKCINKSRGSEQYEVIVIWKVRVAAIPFAYYSLCAEDEFMKPSSTKKWLYFGSRYSTRSWIDNRRYREPKMAREKIRQRDFLPPQKRDREKSHKWARLQRENRPVVTTRCRQRNQRKWFASSGALV